MLYHLSHRHSTSRFVDWIAAHQCCDLLGKLVAGRSDVDADERLVGLLRDRLGHFELQAQFAGLGQVRAGLQPLEGCLLKIPGQSKLAAFKIKVRKTG